MDYKVFYRKYRPKNFSELIGQEHIKKILSNSVKTGKIAHAYLFTGPRGTGKTSTAKIFAKVLNCLNNKNGDSCESCDMCKNSGDSADIIEIDAASNNGVEEIRNLRESVKVSSYNSKYKVYIIDEVHMLSNSAWNAFLKTLEEPPSNVIFILATTEINKVPETVLSRCQRFDFSKIPSDTMLEYLTKISKEEEINIDKDALLEIVKMSNGCLRDALSDLDKISKFNDKIDLDVIENIFGLLTQKKLSDLYNCIKCKDVDKINLLLNEIEVSGITPINFVNDFVNYLLNILVNNEYKNNEDLLIIKEIVFKMNNLVGNFNSFVNPFTLIKVELITCYVTEKNDVNISREIKNDEIIQDKIVINKKEVPISADENILECTFNVNSVKSIRLNNSFVGASKECKNKFIRLWQNMTDNLLIENNYKILGYFNNLSVEVVSNTNALFSFVNLNDTVLFNTNVSEIEDYFNKFNNSDYKFIALTKDEWEKHKKDFIANKEKKYVYIEENKIVNDKNDIKNKNIAEDNFGDDIIELRSEI